MQALLPLISSFSGDIKNLLGEVGKEFESKYNTMGIDEPCNRQNDCSSTGIAGDKSSPALGGKIGCCPDKSGKTVCQFKRPDYLGISYCPLESKASLFSAPGTALPTIAELEYPQKLKDHAVDVYKGGGEKDAETPEEKLAEYKLYRKDAIEGAKLSEPSKFPEIFSGVLGKLASTAGVPGGEEISRAVSGAISALPGGKLDLGKIAEFVKGSLNSK